MHTIHLEPGAQSCVYPVFIGAGLLRDARVLRPFVDGGVAMVVSNETVAPLFADQVRAMLGDCRVFAVNLPDGEQHKTLDNVVRIIDALAANRCGRDATVIALGGGVVGDVAGFAAACYQRGAGLVQIPTTLLAQVDAAVGGKTGVNHAAGKNLIGAFYQPKCVIADTDTLHSLDQRELRAGLAEVIKYGLIRDAGFFAWLEENMAKLLRRETGALTRAIEQSCRHKAAVVAADEKENAAAGRALLNLGHTFAHAMEAALGYRRLLHGEAVAIGTLMAADLSRRMGRLGGGEVARIARIMGEAGLPAAPPPAMTVEKFLQFMRLDKKSRGGKIRLVLLEEIGRARVVADYAAEDLHATLRAFTAGRR